MMYRRHNHIAGFTLTEMAIVLGVVGVLVAGLWNLISGANQQARDESAASQQGQLIAAVKAFLYSADGQNFMTNNNGCGGNCNPSVNFALPLPTSTNPAGTAGCVSDGALTAAMNDPTNGLSERTTWCNLLPPGFSQGTVNSYSQNFSIRVLRDATGSGQAPNSYSFMVLTLATATTPIPDTSGARISALIGGDGGFIYNNPVCTAAASSTTACGSYGGWTAITTGGSPGYGFAPASSVSGSVASRSYVTPQLNALSDWLARVNMPGDITHILNTMTVPEYLGGNDLNMGSYASPLVVGGAGNLNLQGGTMNFALTGSTTGGGVMNAQGGRINMNVGNIYMDNFGTANTGELAAEINLQGGQITSTGAATAANPSGFLGNDTISLAGTADTTSPFYMNALITASMPCTIDHWVAPPPAGGTWVDTSGNACGFAIKSGSIIVSGLVSANGFYAGTFIYNASDERLKKDIHPLVDPLKDIEKINPVSFTFKDSGKKTMGVIAQELEKIYPELVAMGDKGLKYVSYEGLIAPLIGAVQQLKKENDDLRHQIELQNKRIDQIENDLRKKPAP